MEIVTDPRRDANGQVWRPFWSLLIVFLLGGLVCSILPTPDSWSDARSHWLPPAAVGLMAACLFIASFWIYRRSGMVFKIQALILWLLLGAVVIGATCALYDSFLFLREVRDHL
jgi:hypothetical protein